MKISHSGLLFWATLYIQKQRTKYYMQKIVCKAKISEYRVERRTKIITEYRQTGGDADGDGDNIVGMGGYIGSLDGE